MVGVAVRPRVGTAVDVGGPTSSRELFVSVLPWQELEESASDAPDSAVMSLSESDIGSTASTYLAVRLITCDEDRRGHDYTIVDPQRRGAADPPRASESRSAAVGHAQR